MDRDYTMTGFVEKSNTGPRGCGGLITKLVIAPEVRLEGYVHSPDEKPEVSIPGRHAIRVGDRLRLRYAIHTEVYWGIAYDILDEHGNILHSDVSDDFNFVLKP